MKSMRTDHLSSSIYSSYLNLKNVSPNSIDHENVIQQVQSTINLVKWSYCKLQTNNLPLQPKLTIDTFCILRRQVALLYGSIVTLGDKIFSVALQKQTNNEGMKHGG